jgi:CBS domain containing-hemolysin-like protein
MIHVILIACCVVGSAFFSGAETALVSASRIKIRHMANRGDRRAIAVERFLANPEHFLSVTLVGTNIFVVLGSILAVMYTISLLDQRENLGMAISTLVMTPIMLIFGETIPKTFFYHHANWIVLRIVPILKVFAVIFYPLVKMCSLPARAVARLIGDRGKTKNPFVTREELKLLIIEGQSDLNVHEQKMISHLFKFSDTIARSVMIPMEKVVAVDVKGTVADAVRLIRETGHSRLPLYDGRSDHIVGCVTAQEVLGQDEDLPLFRVRRPVIFVPENKGLSWLLLHLKQVGQHMAIVVNRYRRGTGLVTLEDIVEEIVGEIEDEHDKSPHKDQTEGPRREEGAKGKSSTRRV